MGMFEQIRRKILASVAFASLMRIDEVRITQGEGRYVADGEILKPLTLENTGSVLEDVPICLPFAHSGGGLFGMSKRNEIAVVQYIEGHRAFPVVTGFWTQLYAGACDDKAVVSLHAGDGKLRVANAQASLYGILKKVLQALKGLKTQGGPSNQVISPDTIALLETEQQKLAQLFVE